MRTAQVTALQQREDSIRKRLLVSLQEYSKRMGTPIPPESTNLADLIHFNSDIISRSWESLMMQSSRVHDNPYDRTSHYSANSRQDPSNSRLNSTGFRTERSASPPRDTVPIRSHPTSFLSKSMGDSNQFYNTKDNHQEESYHPFRDKMKRAQHTFSSLKESQF